MVRDAELVVQYCQCQAGPAGDEVLEKSGSDKRHLAKSARVPDAPRGEGPIAVPSPWAPTSMRLAGLHYRTLHTAVAVDGRVG